MNPMKKNHDAMLRTGAMALAAAGASTAATAATVQITFNNSFISTTSGNQLVTDFGVDGVNETFGMARSFRRGMGTHFGWVSDFVAQARFAGAVGFTFASGRKVGSARRYGTINGWNRVEVQGVVGIKFTDAFIRAGAVTEGYLDVGAKGFKVSVFRVFCEAAGGAISGLAGFDAAAEYVGPTVPEPPGLGLLALGASGLLARRRRTMAA